VTIGAGTSKEGRRVISQGFTKKWLTPLLIALGIVSITLLHYETSTQHLLLHELYQRLYYIPIVYAAYRYGLAGALAASISSAILYAPHIFIHWENRYIYMLNQNAEIIMFQLIAVVTGLLATAEKRERRRYERTAHELHQAYEELKLAYNQLIRADRLVPCLINS
jgi:K+-sensing histidine kinase KdpD